MRWIGATRFPAVEDPWIDEQLKAGFVERGPNSRVEDWCSDFLDFEDFNTRTVQDWDLDQAGDSMKQCMQNRSTMRTTGYFLRNATALNDFR